MVWLDYPIMVDDSSAAPPAHGSPSSSSIKVPHGWRRTHGPDLLAEVAFIGTGWKPFARRNSQPSTRVSRREGLVSLKEAMDVADDLARTLFQHQCDDGCGRWAKHVEPINGESRKPIRFGP